MSSRCGPANWRASFTLSPCSKALRIEIAYLPIDDDRALAHDRDSNRQAWRHFARLVDDPVKAGNGGIETPPRGLVTVQVGARVIFRTDRHQQATGLI